MHELCLYNIALRWRVSLAQNNHLAAEKSHEVVQMSREQVQKVTQWPSAALECYNIC